ncbi:DUF2927 domain-containing protein [Qingshengfaniella alkalisoli]|uniref:DUF2927 domain-containing protein n=2 Tax=Qingshengfaniella alkalisoli TaxID=2599296 RepID=A0A5B8I8W0_9RHOB|nr:DUF2927 domain-containing protein [Qingshengfaniella alkalisoli]
MKLFAVSYPQAPQRSNEEIARDFIDLTFFLESGTPLPILTRFEEPVTVALRGPSPAIVGYELDRLITRLQREARIDVRRVADGSAAALNVEAVPRSDMQRLVPSAACFVVPANIRWSEFRGDMRRADLNWSRLQTRRAATVFIPTQISPQEVRDCLHEEVAQALGPLNDLYRLEDSIFNDDNLNSVLTGFDMIVLRATYDDSLRTGMTSGEVAARLPAILQRINPKGARYATRPLQPTPREWLNAIEAALSEGRSGRRSAAEKALEIARGQGWRDSRLGLSLFTLARLTDVHNGDLALARFMEAAEVYDSRQATQIHAAHVGMQIAAFALAAEEYPLAVGIADRYIPVARQAENGSLLSDLLMVKAVAFEASGRQKEADALRWESLGWGRYGSRSDAELLQREREIETLVR